jgi:hypothetical protein
MTSGIGGRTCCAHACENRMTDTDNRASEKKRGSIGFCRRDTGRSCQSSFYSLLSLLLLLLLLLILLLVLHVVPGTHWKAIELVLSIVTRLYCFVPAVSAAGPELLVPRLDIWSLRFFSPFPVSSRVFGPRGDYYLCS